MAEIRVIEGSGLYYNPPAELDPAIHLYALATHRLVEAMNRVGVFRQLSGLVNGEAERAYVLSGALLQATRVSVMLRSWRDGHDLVEIDQELPPIS